MLPTQQPDDYSGLARLAAFATPVAMALAALRGYFALVSRKELREALATMERQRAEARREAEAMHAKRHEETQRSFENLFARMGDVEQRVAGVESELRVRFNGQQA